MTVLKSDGKTPETRDELIICVTVERNSSNSPRRETLE